jgi:Tfp pilus assembly protein PilN
MMVPGKRLNHVPSAWQDHWPVYAWLGVCGLVLLGMMLLWQQLQRQQTALDGRMQQLAAPMQPREARSSSNPVNTEEVSAVRSAISDLTLPWQVMFTTLETVHNNEIKLLSLEPNNRQGSIRVSAEATSVNAMLSYVKSLSQQPGLRDVFLRSHERNNASNNIQFIVEATWHP